MTLLLTLALDRIFTVTGTFGHSKPTAAQGTVALSGVSLLAAHLRCLVHYERRAAFTTREGALIGRPLALLAGTVRSG